MRPLAVVLLAAGKGTRMKSELPKVLHRLAGRPLVFYPLDLALALEARKIAIVVGHQAERVKRTVRRGYTQRRVEFVLQEKQEGTGHAVLQAKTALRGFTGDVLILSGDIPLLTPATIRKFLRQHRQSSPGLSLVTCDLENPTGYGRCLVDARGRLREIVEEKDATPEQRLIREINAGIYLMDAKLLWWALSRIGKDNAQGEMYLTDIAGVVRRRGKTIRVFKAADSHEVMGINTRAELARANRLYKKIKTAR